LKYVDISAFSSPKIIEKFSPFCALQFGVAILEKNTGLHKAYGKISPPNHRVGLFCLTSTQNKE
jgi:hypothetical protein